MKTKPTTKQSKVDAAVFRNKTVVIGVTASIAAYKTLNIIKQLRAKKADVHVMMTQHATKLVDPREFQKATGNPVRTELFEQNINYQSYLKNNRPIKHISLADMADLILICPATAQVIGKVANGLCDDLISTSICATSAPVIFCPAMNVKMWNNLLVRSNVQTLSNAGYQFVDPEKGELACGYQGVGRLASPKPIMDSLLHALKKTHDLKGRNIIVTAGPTSEPIDAVRVITNKSSGKMGIAIADECHRRGANVTLIRGHTVVDPRFPLNDIQITTVHELHDQLKAHAKKADVIIHAAAVSDYTLPAKNEKIKSGQPLNLELQPTTKILEKIKKWNPQVYLVGFKAEFSVSKKTLEKRAQTLRGDAQANMIVANDVGKPKRGFDTETNEVLVVKEDKSIQLPLSSKQHIASSLLDIIGAAQ